MLAANYVAGGWRTHYPVLYTGRERAWSRTSASSTCGRSPRKPAITVDDVAKRLIDYGFHAPTMSFPVAGTLMVEPTESRTWPSCDRFCDAMIAIRAEIARVACRRVATPTTTRWATRRTPRKCSSRASGSIPYTMPSRRPTR